MAQYKDLRMLPAGSELDDPILILGPLRQNGSHEFVMLGSPSINQGKDDFSSHFPIDVDDTVDLYEQARRLLLLLPDYEKQAMLIELRSIAECAGFVVSLDDESIEFQILYLSTVLEEIGEIFWDD